MNTLSEIHDSSIFTYNRSKVHFLVDFAEQPLAGMGKVMKVNYGRVMISAATLAIVLKACGYLLGAAATYVVAKQVLRLADWNMVLEVLR